MELKLNKTEIERIIAERFNVDPKQVVASVNEVWVGQGMAEHLAKEPVVYVTKPMEETPL